MKTSGPRSLVVESDGDTRRRIASWLQDDGLEVVTCPGPGKPDYECPWARGETCLLAYGADVIVLDLWLESDTLFRGNPGSEVLTYYRALGKPVVALADTDDPLRPVHDEGIVALKRPPGRDALVAAVRGLLGRGRDDRWPPASTVPS